jgi:hypothetical protein
MAALAVAGDFEENKAGAAVPPGARGSSASTAVHGMQSMPFCMQI